VRLLAIILTFVHFAEQAGNTDVLDHRNSLDRLEVAGCYVPTMTWPVVLSTIDADAAVISAPVP